MLISGGAAVLLACPRSVALGLLPLALGRCALGSTYSPATYTSVALYAPAAYAPAAARGGGEGLALGLRALRHAYELTGGLAWRVLSKLPTPSEWLRWGGEVCGAALWAGGRSLSLGTQLGWWAVEVGARAASLAGTAVGKLPTPSEWLRWGGEACGAAVWAGGHSLSLGSRLGWWAVEAVARAASLAGTAVGVG